MHIESAPREGPTIETYLDMDESINIFMKNKNKK